MSTLTFAALERAAELLRNLGPDSLEQWMIEQGAPPEEGWRLLVPKGMFDRGSYGAPYYVRESELLPQMDRPSIYITKGLP